VAEVGRVARNQPQRGTALVPGQGALEPAVVEREPEAGALLDVEIGEVAAAAQPGGEDALGQLRLDQPDREPPPARPRRGRRGSTAAIMRSAIASRSSYPGADGAMTRG
jgi:hypothetical protein